ncbi:hypothetical protein FV242_08255 [Methylobacterium sp. WL64]|nr:hypothetical protein FV242_08255 [Methylobacterium sp. WL64]
MTPARFLLAAIMLTPAVPVEAQDSTRETNALRDMARAQERQARSLERLQVQLKDQATQQDRAQRNAERDARSSRRFDRPEATLRRVP